MTNFDGTFDAAFESVVELFKEQGAAHPLGGSSLAIYKDGVQVVNVWQGFAKENQAWQQDTLSDVFSCTKGVISILIAKLIEEKKLNPEEKVATYWPEFAQGGKQDVKVKTVLQHRAGLSAVRRDLSYEEVIDNHTVIEELAKQEPLWEPDSTHAYHALTYGHLVSKLIHCVTGLTANQYLQKYVTGPIDAEMYIGTPTSVLPRVATLISDGNFKSQNPEVGTDGYWSEKAITVGGALPVDPTQEHGFNDARTLGAELAGANGVTNANGLAKIYSAAVTETNGVRLVSDEGIRNSCQPAAVGENRWHEPGPYAAWGMGFMLPTAGFVFPGGASGIGFGHNGMGGQAGWGSLETRVGFGYTTTYLKNSPETQKNQQDLVIELNRVIAGK